MVDHRHVTVADDRRMNKKNKARARAGGHRRCTSATRCSSPSTGDRALRPSPSSSRTAATTRDFWVFVIGPVTGATVAAAYYKVINAMQDKEAENEPAAADRADTDVKPVEA